MPTLTAVPPHVIELVDHGYSAWNRREVDGVLAVMHPDVEIRPVLGAVPHADVYRGHEGAARWHGDVFDSWAEFRAEVEEIVHAGGERYVVLLRFIARGRASGIEIELRGAHLHTMRDGLVAKLRGYSDQEEALRAAGLG
jgi:ketosteroid isomerase-like protein